MTILPLMLLIYSKCAKFRNSNLISLRKYKNQEKNKKNRTHSEQIGDKSFPKRQCFIG
jgi:hypothetical protein